MLTPEIALTASVIAVLLTLINCLMSFSIRRSLNHQMDELRAELDANLSASHGLARHVRELQRNQHSSNTTPTQDREDFASRFAAEQAASARDLEDLDDEVEESTMSLAEKLGLSQSEAEIITHLRPRQKRRVRETA